MIFKKNMILLKNGSIVLNNKLVKKDILIDNDLIITTNDGQNFTIGFPQPSDYKVKNVDIDNDGALMVQVGEEIRKVVAGDVSIRPKK